MNHTLSCVYSIPEKESKQRLSHILCNLNTYPIHSRNKNGLNAKKDIIIQSMYMQKKYNAQKRKINIYEKINSFPNGIISMKTVSRAFFKMIEMSSLFPDFIQ